MDHESVNEITRRVGLIVEDLRNELKQDAAGLREEVKQDVSRLREELTQQMGALRDDLRQELKHGLGGLREELKQDIDASSEDAKRYFGVLAEDLRDGNRLLAEGQALLAIRVDGLTQVVQLSYAELTERANDHENRIGALERRQP